MEMEKQRATGTKEPVGAVNHNQFDEELNEIDWEQIDWDAVERDVNRLQTRIVKAEKEGRWNKVKALQYLLSRSRSAKLLAIRKVTENQGAHTPGVDKIT
jgi:RNA-directed DNA polymerase